MHSSLFLFTLAAFSSLTSACLYKRGNDDGEGSFSYDRETGPLAWHRLAGQNSRINKQNFTLCATGKNQSPINVTPNDGVKLAGKIQMKYPQWGNEVEVANNGHTIVFTPKDAGPKGKYEAVLDNKSYKLLQFHFHAPSEHRFMDEYYPLEVHFVHQADDGALAVVGIFFDLHEGWGDKLLLSTTQVVESVKVADRKAKADNIDLSSVMDVTNISKAHTYSGSLTTPPCTEGISWYVVEQSLNMSVKQFKQWKSVMKFNSRNTQNAPGKINLIEFAAQGLGNKAAPKRRRR